MSLSWNDIFDFSSLEPDLAPSTPPPAFDAKERDLCSDFSCCGLSLPDLHALLDHFEEHHVVVGGQPSSLPQVISYPQPDPPAEPSTLFASPSDFNPATQTYLDVPDNDFSDSTSDTSGGSTFSSPNPSEPVCLPPSLLTVHPPHQPTLKRVRERPPHAHAKSKPSKTKAHLLGTCHGKHSSAEAPSQRKRLPRAREKAYKCPRPGCSKAYLNPNGLKYHLEKGTCTIERLANSTALFPATAPGPVSSQEPSAPVVHRL